MCAQHTTGENISSLSSSLQAEGGRLWAFYKSSSSSSSSSSGYETQLLARLHFAARKQVKNGNLDVARNLYRKALQLTNFQFARTFLLWGLLEQRANRIQVLLICC